MVLARSRMGRVGRKGKGRKEPADSAAWQRPRLWLVTFYLIRLSVGLVQAGGHDYLMDPNLEGGSDIRSLAA